MYLVKLDLCTGTMFIAGVELRMRRENVHVDIFTMSK